MVFLKNLRRVFRQYRPFWKQLLFSQALVFFYSVLLLLIPHQIANLINLGIQQKNLEVVIDSSINILLLAVGAGAFRMANMYYAARFSEGTAHFLRINVFGKVQAYSSGNLDQYSVGEITGRLTNDVKEVSTAVLLTIRDLFTASLQILIALVFVYIYSPDLIGIILLIIPLLVLVLGGWVLKVGGQYKTRQKNIGKLNTITQEDFAGIRIIKAFVRQEYEKEHFDKANSEIKKSSMKPLKTVSIVIPSLFFIVGLSIGLAVWVGGNQIILGSMNVGELVAFSQYVSAIIGQALILAIAIPQVISAETSAARLTQLYDVKPDIQDQPTTQFAVPVEEKGRVVFENVSFSYDKNPDHPTISNVNLVVEPGEKIAFLGATGSGKTTIVNLIPRFYDTTIGKVTLDGVDVRLIPQKKLRQMVALALQESILFSGSIQENIAFGKPEATFDEITDSAKAAQAHDFVEAIPEKYDAHVARRGTNFSGGQRQRLSIARAITVKPKVVIFDDSTSAVDVATETKIQTATDNLLKGTTTFTVAQRISTVLTADKIVLLDAGKIVAMGNHKELMEKSPLYREIFESQLGGLKKEDVT